MPAFIVLPFISLICFITAICLTLNMIINIRKQGKNRKNEREMKKQNHNRVISLVTALCTYVAGGVACFNINPHARWNIMESLSIYYTDFVYQFRRDKIWQEDNGKR